MSRNGDDYKIELLPVTEAHFAALPRDAASGVPAVFQMKKLAEAIWPPPMEGMRIKVFVELEIEK